MVEQSGELTKKLLDLMRETGYPLIQYNGQRRYGPPPDWVGPSPPRGCEVFIGKLPREIFEDELVPVFSMIGKIYEMRLMMDFYGSNRGYAFVTYATKAEATRAVKELNGYQIRPGRNIGVVKSVDNCRLFVGSIPKTKTREEVVEELSKYVSGIVDVILYKNCFNRRLNRGFAFVEFSSHRAAAMAQRALGLGSVKLGDQDVNIDWADPEPDIDDEHMKWVKVLHVRNFLIRTRPEIIQSVFEKTINNKIEHIKKIYHYAFIHFHERSHAELAMQKLQNKEIDGSVVEIRWAKPVDPELYKIQKHIRGNAKFSNNFGLSQTLLLYIQDLQSLEKKEYSTDSHKEDEGIGSACAGSECGSPVNMNSMNTHFTGNGYTVATAKLYSLCKRFMWSQPSYEYQKYLDPQGRELWVAKLELPLVGLPLLSVPQRIGPIITSPCYSMQQATVEAAECALKLIQTLQKSNVLHQAQTPVTSLSPVYTTMIPQVPSCLDLPYDYTIPQRMPVAHSPIIWRSI